MTDRSRPLHPFDAAIRLESLGAGRFGGATHPAWSNMVGPFGGMTSAVLLNAACLHPDRLGEPVALTVNFAGPIADGPFELRARPMRTNRSTQHWWVELQQGDAVAATASAVFAVPRDTWTASELPMPAVPPVEQITPCVPPPEIGWAHRYEMRFAQGGWPDLSRDEPLPQATTRMWIRDEPPRPLDALALVAIADAFYPRVFRRLQRFVPVGTVTLSTYLHAGPARFAAQADRPLLACATGLRYENGFYDQRGELWADDGTLLASTVQLAYFKA